MKIRINFFHIVLLIYFVAQVQAQPTDSLSDRHIFEGQWKLVAYKDLRTKKIVKEPTNLTRSVVLKFEDDGFQGHIEGHTVKNPIHGQYFIRNNNGIQFLSVGVQTNDREARGWGDTIHLTLLDATSYTFQKDTLVIKYEDNKKAMLFVRTYEEPENNSQIYK